MLVDLSFKRHMGGVVSSISRGPCVSDKGLDRNLVCFVYKIKVCSGSQEASHEERLNELWLYTANLNYIHV